MPASQDYERLVRVGPGTPMGNLLRRYWHPVGCSNLVTSKPRRIKLLGEELVLYRGESGKPALMELRCAHRNVALDYGRVEGDSIRCPYHGWLYDETGACVAQPCEAEPKIVPGMHLKGYRTEEVSGLIFAYVGPDPAPVLPLYDVLLMTEGEKQIRVSKTETNWVQGAENILDTSHFAWLHGYTFPFFSAKRLDAQFVTQDYGLEIHMAPEGSAAAEVVPYVFPYTNRFALPAAPGAPMMQCMVFRVPSDDTSHENYFVAFHPSATPLAEPPPPVGVRIESKTGEYKPMAADWWGIDLGDQDRMAIEQQGTITDRTKEHLARSDVGIVRMRRMLEDGMAAVEAGRDPLGVIRDPAKQFVEFNLQITNISQEEGNDTDYNVGLFKEELSTV